MQVDILSWRNKTQRVHTQVKDICAILSGLVVAQDYRRGQALVVNRNFADNNEFFQVPCLLACLRHMRCNAAAARAFGCELMYKRVPGPELACPATCTHLLRSMTGPRFGQRMTLTGAEGAAMTAEEDQLRHEQRMSPP